MTQTAASRALRVWILLTAVEPFLSSCLDQPLQHPHFGPDASETTTMPKLVPQSAVSSLDGRILNVLATAYARHDLRADEVAAQLFGSGDAKDTELEFSVHGIQILQGKYLEFLRQAIPTTLKNQDEGAIAAEDLPEEITVGQDTLTPEKCQRSADSILVLNNGMRFAVDLYRKDLAPCTYNMTHDLRRLFNRVMLTGWVRVRLAGSDANAYTEVNTMRELVEWLTQKGFHINVVGHTYLATFIKLYKAQGDMVLATTEVPTPLWIDTELQTASGQKVSVPATHSETLFEFKHPKFPDAGIKIYFSDKGFVFEDSVAQNPHWAGDRRIPLFPSANLVAILNKSAELYQAFEEYKKLFPSKPKLGGFGLLGVCNDGTALLWKSLGIASNQLPYPLIRTDQIALPATFSHLELWNSVPTDATVSALQTDPRVRLQNLAERTRTTSPFEELSPFPDYNDVLKEILPTNIPGDKR